MIFRGAVGSRDVTDDAGSQSDSALLHVSIN